MEQIGAGRSVGPIVDCYPQPREREADPPAARRGWRSLLGVPVPDDEVVRILRRLGLDVTPAADGWDVDRADLPRRSAARGRT